MAKKHGFLPNQPLFYVLASVRFQPWMRLPSKIPEIQDELRDRFPLVNQVMVGQISLGVPSLEGSPMQPRPIAWAFHAADRKLGCQLSADQVVVHATAYESFEKFAEELRIVLAAVERHARLFDVGAIGIRYLDRVAPKDGETLADYMHAESLPRRLGDLEPFSGLSQAVYRTRTGILQARFWTGENYFSVPDDLVPLYAMTQDLDAGGAPIPPLAPGHGILDSDSIWTSPQPTRMDASAIISKLGELHEHSHEYFNAACKPHAYQVWAGDKK